MCDEHSLLSFLLRIVITGLIGGLVGLGGGWLMTRKGKKDDAQFAARMRQNMADMEREARQVQDIQTFKGLADDLAKECDLILKIHGENRHAREARDRLHALLVRINAAG